MSSPASGAVRSLRAALLGAVCVSLALTGHVVGGGRAPSLWALVILAVPMGGASLALTSRRRGLPVIALTVAGSQLLLHQALMWSAAGCAVAGPQTHLGHPAAAPVVECASMPGMGPTAAAAHFSTLGMLLGHAVAAAVTTVVLAYGESLIWGVWRRIVRSPAVAARPVRSLGRLVIGYSRSIPRPRTPGGLTRRRGPPALAPVAV